MNATSEMNLYASSLESWRVRADAVFQRWDDILWDDKKQGLQTLVEGEGKPHSSHFGTIWLLSLHTRAAFR